MSTDLIINVTHYETRVALMENGTVSELFIERSGERSIAGNICKGRVVRVLPGMQAAFVDIGLKKAAFLYVSDVYDNLDEIEKIMTGNEEIDEDAELHQEQVEATWPGELHIEDRLQEGQDPGSGGQRTIGQQRSAHYLAHLYPGASSCAHANNGPCWDFTAN